MPFREIAREFEKEHPGARVYLEAAGSRDCARKISDLGRGCDVMASADYAVIDTMLIPEHADWSIRFAANEMVIAHTDRSRHAEQLTADNWPRILMREDVAFGRSDPNSDPCGYRTVLMLKLAEDYYGRPGLADEFLNKDTRYIRPKETDLLALLETRALDYVFIYRSVAEQHGLKWLRLPNAINLKDPGLAGAYAEVAVEITGAAPGTTIVRKGEPMVYGVTIPKSSPNPAAALAFVEFLLEEDKGLAIIAANSQPPVVPARCDTYNYLPASLRKYARQP